MNTETTTRVESLINLNFQIFKENLQTSFTEQLKNLHLNYLSDLRQEQISALILSHKIENEPEAAPQWLNMEYIQKGNIQLLAFSLIKEKIDDRLKQTQDSKEIAALISLDPALTMKTFRSANSAYYSLSHQQESISKITTLLGVSELKKISSSCKTDESSTKNDFFLNFWKQSIATAVFSEELAKVMGIKKTERFFNYGLLRNIGRLAIYSCIPKLYPEIIKSISYSKMHPCAKEKKLLGFCHCQAGYELSKNWNLSTTIKDTISCFRHPIEKIELVRTETAIVHVADILSQIHGYGPGGDGLIAPLDYDVWKLLKLKKKQLPEVSGNCVKKIINIQKKIKTI